MGTRERSSCIFGNSRMLETVLVLERHAPIHAQGIGKILGVASTAIAPVLKRLAEAGLVREVPGNHDFGARYFEPAASETETWRALVRLCVALQEPRTLF